MFIERQPKRDGCPDSFAVQVTFKPARRIEMANELSTVQQLLWVAGRSGPATFSTSKQSENPARLRPVHREYQPPFRQGDSSLLEFSPFPPPDRGETKGDIAIPGQGPRELQLYEEACNER